MKTSTILISLLVVSILVNVGLIGIYIPAEQAMISQLIDKTNTLGMENMQLHRQLD
jgi:hypothetical protein